MSFPLPLTPVSILLGKKTAKKKLREEKETLGKREKLPTNEMEKAQLINMLFDLTMRLKDQMDKNRNSTSALMAKALSLKEQIRAQGNCQPDENRLELSEENEQLKSAILEYKQTLEILIERHLTQMAELHQEHLTRERQLEECLATEKLLVRALRVQNVRLQERIETMLQDMKAAYSEDKISVQEEEAYIVALENENKALRSAMGIDRV